ncbi:FadR/GntR family transcriptional regulator [Dehalobacterium formicoaceticum]|uniref:FadR family transcriptional regulator n=1 Tax=Dehalobacterium formicoaceticum TaxID=51515 RepID=A0ABT1Y128_9FIRM|nr:FadR/GntR family transcriptional regulator [Dehalobacterium formicoaceticum]MCR6544567.1 FadR family transcriptional regulator [Dehalobacterium formicoaceticum]
MIKISIPDEELELNKMTKKNSEMLYFQVVERIREWIMKGYLKEGDILPSERELAQMLNVSRMPVSQALKILEFLGAIQYVRGKGVIVKKIDINYLLSNIGFLLFDPENSLHDLFEARDAIEIKAVQLAVQNRTKKDMDIMEDAIMEMERNIIMKKDVGNASIRFHSAIIAASGNDIIIKINEILMEPLKYSRKLSLKEILQQNTALSYHKELFQAIKEQDVEKATLAMHEHLCDLHNAIKE